MPPFEIVSDFKLEGDQPQAIDLLVAGLEAGVPYQTLLGVTGSGKTFTMANVIERVQRPALVLVHNKILAAQLYREFKDLFPKNAVEFFVSYYDYYQPEAYIPRSDTYIEKDSSINEELDKMRLSTTKSVLTRRDVIVVSSVSCIYGIGSPKDFKNMVTVVEVGREMDRDDLLRGLVGALYVRSDMDFHRGTFRVRGDVVDVYPAYEDKSAIRIEFFGDTIEAIHEIDPLTGKRRRGLQREVFYPASFYVTPDDRLQAALRSIAVELEERLDELRAEDKLVEAQRLEGRTKYDMEMMAEMGTCQGIENYSRHLDQRRPGSPPHTLLDYFDGDFLHFVDESHVAVPQVRAMYNGDRSRKETLVNYGFRLPSALDNRPLKFEEYEEFLQQVIYVSATPTEWELKKSKGIVAEQIVRPTGLMDPAIEVRKATDQVDDLLGEVRSEAERGNRTLITTLTKRMAEDLTEYYRELGVKVRYMHSDIDTLERAEIIRELRLGVFDVLIGINLLREGLDLPEVALVAILDADKEGFLRSRTSLIQTSGRAARNIDGRVIFYADKMTNSMSATIEETERRREIQKAYNEEHGITPASIKKEVKRILDTVYEADYVTVEVGEDVAEYGQVLSPKEYKRRSAKMRKKMLAAANNLEFEKAAKLRDELLVLERRMIDSA
ncbi:excinuclease ABC subunit UvrB [Candidatus Sumerlaeota bacterium]|nr:excinuclease ABC subunit UvrB [Candidatus Sumerlaeota bacterium]